MEAKDFLLRTLTVVGKDKAVEEKDEKFLKKYATVVGSAEAIEEWCRPIEPVLVPWFLVQDETSWNEAYADGAGPLGDYYEDYPQEDLWNVAENRPCNYNDREYTGTLDDVDVVGSVHWESDNAQSVTIDGTKYYAEIFYDMNPRELPLFNDVALTESADKTLIITAVAYSGDCQHCWAGTYNAPGAQLPWAVLDFAEPMEGKVTIKYNEVEYHPWKKEKFNKYGIASIPSFTGVAKLPDTPAEALVKDNYEVTILPKA